MLRRLVVACCIAFVGFSSSVLANTLSPAEQAIVNAVNQRQPSALPMIEKLVNINSGTQNIDGVKEVGNIVKTEFEKLGFKGTWVEVPADMKRAGTLVLTREGNKGKRLLLIGHLDTVFANNDPFNHFEQQKTTVTGPGVIDDKGGIVVMLQALTALNDAHLLDNTNITIVFPGDEENSGKPVSISRAPLINAAKNKDIALDFEPAFHLNTATISRRGTGTWTLNALGKEAHSSIVFQPAVGFGAILEMSRILNAFRVELAHEKYFTFNPGLIAGGTLNTPAPDGASFTAAGKKNVVAQTTTTLGDIRFISVEQKLAMQAAMQKIVAEHLPGTDANITFVDSIPPMPPTAQNEALLHMYSQISNDLELGSVTAVDPGTRGAGDLSHVAGIVPACLGGLGPVGTGMHSKDETMDIASLSINAQRAALLIYRLTQ